jgi:hypothetical protein
VPGTTAISGDEFAELTTRSTVVALVICPHPEFGWPEAEITRIYRKPDFVAADPFRYFLGPGNDQRAFAGSKAVTLTSRVWIDSKPVVLPASPWFVDWVVTRRCRTHYSLGPWRIECHLCRGGSRFELGPPRQVRMATVKLAQLADGLLTSGPGPHCVSLPDLQRAITT